MLILSKLENVKTRQCQTCQYQKCQCQKCHFSGVKRSQTILRFLDVTCVVRLVHLEEFSSFVFLPNLTHAWRKVVASCPVVFFPSSCWYCFNSKIGFRWNRCIFAQPKFQQTLSGKQILSSVHNFDKIRKRLSGKKYWLSVTIFRSSFSFWK